MEPFEYSERTTAQIIKYSFSIILIIRSTLAFLGSKSPMRKCPLLLVRVDPGLCPKHTLSSKWGLIASLPLAALVHWWLPRGFKICAALPWFKPAQPWFNSLPWSGTKTKLTYFKDCQWLPLTRNWLTFRLQKHVPRAVQGKALKDRIDCSMQIVLS